MPNNLVEGHLEILGRGQIVNLMLEQRTSDPAGLGVSDTGRMWIRTDSTPDMLWYWNGTAAVSLGAATSFDAEAAQDAINDAIAAGTHTGITITYGDPANSFTFAVTNSPLLGGNDSAYHRARGNHTGTQAAATISDLAAVVQAYKLSAFAPPDAPVAMGSQRITGVADPSGAQDAATKAYVDAVANGLDNKTTARLATTANDSLSGLAARDGVTPVAGDRVLAKDQTTGSQNGIYIAAAGAWTRATDADISAEVTAGLYVFVSEGTVNGDNGFTLTTNDPIVLGTTALVFVQSTGAGQIVAGAGITKTGNQLDVGATAGGGITVAADGIGVDSSVARKVVGNLANGGALTAVPFTHSLGTKDVGVWLRRVSDDQIVGMIPWIATDINTVTFYFTTAPATNAYRVLVVG